jgi:hypothetical protein
MLEVSGAAPAIIAASIRISPTKNAWRSDFPDWFYKKTKNIGGGFSKTQIDSQMSFPNGSKLQVP